METVNRGERKRKRKGKKSDLGKKREREREGAMLKVIGEGKICGQRGGQTEGCEEQYNGGEEKLK